MSGQGLAVLKDSAINGGDEGYYYIGSFDVQGNTVISAKITVRRWHSAVTSLFGNLPEFTLRLNGSVAPDLTSFSATGSPESLPSVTILIKGRKIADAV